MLRRWFSSSSTTESVRGWVEQFMKLKPCETCAGTRLRKESLWFKVAEMNIAELSEMDLDHLQEWFAHIEKKLTDKQNVIAKDILKEIREPVSYTHLDVYKRQGF